VPPSAPGLVHSMAGAALAPNLQGMTADQIDDFKEAFSLFDSNGDGTMSAEELGILMRALGRQLSHKQLLDMMNEVDEDKSGSIEFNEFLKLMAKKFHQDDSVEEMKEAFEVIDSNQNGKISADELRHVMNSMGEDVTQEEIDELISLADQDQSGELSFEDFVVFLEDRGLWNMR